jgi:hypothetical protein
MSLAVVARRSLPRLAPLAWRARGVGGGSTARSEEAWATTAPQPPVPLFYSDWAEVVLPGNHRFPMDKYRATRMSLEVRLDRGNARPTAPQQHHTET